MAEMLCSLGEEQQLSSHDLGNARVCEAGTASIRALDMTCLFLLLLPLVCVESAAGCRMCGEAIFLVASEISSHVC